MLILKALYIASIDSLLLYVSNSPCREQTASVTTHYSSYSGRQSVVDAEEKDTIVLDIFAITWNNTDNLATDKEISQFIRLLK